MPSPLIIIPARGGSKGIPHKNLVPLAGRPLIAYTAATALAVAPPDHIILTTDSPEIDAAGRAAGLLPAHIRPPHLASDTAGMREVILDAMDEAGRRGIDFDMVVLLQPTSPLRSAEDVRGAIRAYIDRGDADMVVSVTAAAANPYYDIFEEDADGRLKVAKGDGTYTRRQDAPKVWQYNGAVYVMRPQSVRAYTLGAMPRRYPYEMPPERSVDVDSPLDLAVAETLLKSHC